jgi:hypothetical protein
MTKEMHVEATRRQIATHFCGECVVEPIETEDDCVVFVLKMPQHEPLKTPPLSVAGCFNPDPLEYFIRELYVKPQTRFTVP